MAKGLIIKPNGDLEVKDIDTRRADETHAIIGGWLEQVTTQTWHLYCHEEGWRA